jgi:hypothetical protein
MNRTAPRDDTSMLRDLASAAGGALDRHIGLEVCAMTRTAILSLSGPALALLGLAACGGFDVPRYPTQAPAAARAAAPAAPARIATPAAKPAPQAARPAPAPKRVVAEPAPQPAPVATPPGPQITLDEANEYLLSLPGGAGGMGGGSWN